MLTNAAKVLLAIGIVICEVGGPAAVVWFAANWWLKRQEQKKAASTAGTVEAERLAG